VGSLSFTTAVEAREAAFVIGTAAWTETALKILRARGPSAAWGRGVITFGESLPFLSTFVSIWPGRLLLAPFGAATRFAGSIADATLFVGCSCLGTSGSLCL
jgi:hypothetical protein